MTKDALISAIVSKRKPPSGSPAERSSSNEDDSADASPHPRTSHEPSPEDEVRPRRSRRSSSGNRAHAPVAKNRRSGGGSRKHPLTPPLTSGEEDNSHGDAAMEDDCEEAADTQATSRPMGRRSSQVEMPPPPLPTAAGINRQHRRTRSNVNDGDVSNMLRFGKRLNHIIQEEEQGVAKFTSPVAHRTRGHRPPSRPDPSAPRTIVANAHGSPARPLRAAKQKAVARIKGKARAEEEDENEQEDEEMDLEDDDGAVLVLSSDSEADEPGVNSRRRRSSRTAVKQVETPPSDADEESGGDEEEEHEVEVDIRSNLRAAGRGNKHGKVVKLRSSHKANRDAHGNGDDEPELGEEDEEDEDMEADYVEEEEEEQGELFSRFRLARMLTLIPKCRSGRGRSRSHPRDVKITTTLPER